MFKPILLRAQWIQANKPSILTYQDWCEVYPERRSCNHCQGFYSCQSGDLILEALQEYRQAVAKLLAQVISKVCNDLTPRNSNITVFQRNYLMGIEMFKMLRSI